ncbi:MAG: hypothetical protein MPEBLZ_03932 [Candidatus Methanoperedens nitroreducens]|uniref:Uncharacterized protein n=1 Tax=Candidatus Methanoperedens nitratireducens TaxID=1392998 RepID=A0A0P8C4I0_9EURY|nr:MAG: hypothetical protein MPEBLZ_03932 [Candidatus Methanoperedens sp. BLZ1]
MSMVINIGAFDQLIQNKIDYFFMRLKSESQALNGYDLLIDFPD